MLIKSLITRVAGLRLANAVYRSKAGLWVPQFDFLAPKHRNILALLGRPEGALLIPGSNIVTDAGDIHYAQKAAGEAVTNAFGVLELASAGTPAKGADRSAFTPIASTEKAHDAGYPTTNDADSDNSGSGADVVSYLTSYTTGDFNATGITHGIITNATPGASEPILTGFAFAASFDKTSSDTLKVFVNHEQSGV